MLWVCFLADTHPLAQTRCHPERRITQGGLLQLWKMSRRCRDSLWLTGETSTNRRINGVIRTVGPVSIIPSQPIYKQHIFNDTRKQSRPETTYTSKISHFHRCRNAQRTGSRALVFFFFLALRIGKEFGDIQDHQRVKV